MPYPDEPAEELKEAGFNYPDKNMIRRWVFTRLFFPKHHVMFNDTGFASYLKDGVSKGTALPTML